MSTFSPAALEMIGTMAIPGFLPDHFVVNHKPLGNKCTISWSVRVVTVTGEIKLSYCFQFQKNSNKYIYILFIYIYI